MKVIKIVLTGGPCAGKTTMLELMKGYLDKKKIPCLVIPEAATGLINGNLKPCGNYVEIMRFQDAVLNKQLSNEEIFNKYASSTFADSDICVIIHDRGLLDNKAYFAEEKDFELMLNNYKLAEIDFLDGYDYVFDLISLAVCKPEEYGYNNEARYETLERAVDLDANTTRVWLGHKNMKIIPTYLDIEDEKKIILDYLDEIVYNKQKKQISQMHFEDLSELKKFFGDVNLSDCIDIKDTWLKLDNSDNADCVLSKRTYKGHSSYIIRLQKVEDNEISILDERKIAESEYLGYIKMLKNIKTEEKSEMYFVDNLRLYKVSVSDNGVVLETEKMKYDNDFIDFNECSKGVQKLKK